MDGGYPVFVRGLILHRILPSNFVKKVFQAAVQNYRVDVCIMYHCVELLQCVKACKGSDNFVPGCILTLYDTSLNIAATQLDQNTLLDVVMEIIFSLILLDDSLSFRHGDLHSGNILLQKTNRPRRLKTNTGGEYLTQGLCGHQF